MLISGAGIVFRFAQEAEIAGMLGPSGRLLDEKGADDATRQMVVKEAEVALAPYAGPNGELRLPGTVLLAKARRPA